MFRVLKETEVFNFFFVTLLLQNYTSVFAEILDASSNYRIDCLGLLNFKILFFYILGEFYHVQGKF